MNIFNQDESSFRGMLSICRSVGNSALSLVAALIDISSEGGVWSRLKTLFKIFNPPNFSLSVFAAKSSPVHLLVRDCNWLLASRKSNSILPVSEFFLILNRSKSVRPGSPVAPRYPYNETILSRFSFCLRRSVDVASEASGTYLVSFLACYNYHNLHVG